VAASRSSDGSFGRPEERAVATACACLVFETLGRCGRTLALAQLALCGALEADPLPQVPFFSAVRCDLDDRNAAARAAALLRGRGVVRAGGHLYALTSYDDTAGVVSAGLVALALARLGDLAVDDVPEGRAEPHPRYRCRSLEEYAAGFALPAALALT